MLKWYGWYLQKIEKYNQNKKRKILIAFDDTIVDMLSNKKLNPILTELFIRGRNLNIFVVFITQSCFAVLKNIRLNSTHYFVVKFQTKDSVNKMPVIIQMLTFKTWWIINLHKKCSEKRFSFLVIDTTLGWDHSSGFRNNLLQTIEKLIMTLDDKFKYEKL